METQNCKLTHILDTEMFGNEKRQYFFDIKKTRRQKHYLRITRRDRATNNTYDRAQIVFFEEDLLFFVEAISMLLGRFSNGATNQSLKT